MDVEGFGLVSLWYAKSELFVSFSNLAVMALNIPELLDNIGIELVSLDHQFERQKVLLFAIN